jgi:sugar/nucleoside kinase (ribokinase family)
MTRTSDRQLRPTIVGAGLVALDVVLNDIDDDEPKYLAGGTCGNVLTVLSFLGWDARPIARLKNDLPAEWIYEDLQDCGVDTSLLTARDDGSTPIIIERIRKTNNGQRYHSYSLRCPCCGSYLPGYKSIRGSDANSLTQELGGYQVFFFDRVSRGTLNLAAHSLQRGALVVFEPSGVGDPRLFREAWELAHVVKYSNDRLRDLADLDLKSSLGNNLLLEIETLGASGLRYRSCLDGASRTRWNTLDAIPSPSFKDAAGSGDWCTAGVLHKLARGGLAGFRRRKPGRLKDALRYGQALAAWNCSYESARGGMYEASRPRFDRQIRALLSGRTIRIAIEKTDPSAENLGKLCPNCCEFQPKKRAHAS